MPRRLVEWRRCVETRETKRAGFELELFVRLAKVLLAGKPAELVTFRQACCARGRLSQDLWDKYGLRTAAAWGLCAELLRLNPCSGSACWVLYEARQLRRHLQKSQTSDLLARLEVPNETRAAIQLLRERWQRRGHIPHEVGAILGYPAKDVLGFLGLSEAKWALCCGWQVYGPTDESLKLHSNYKMAEQKAREFLNVPAPRTHQEGEAT